MAEPIPIRADITPEIDQAREFIDYFIQKLQQFRDTSGTVPESVALVFIGTNEENLHSLAHSWSPGTRTKFETCAMAATLLTRRATE